MFSCLAGFFRCSVRKNIVVGGKEYELKISDYTCGCEGWFSVKVWKNKKTFWEFPIIEFNTFNDPLEVAEQQIMEYTAGRQKYLEILKRLES